MLREADCHITAYTTTTPGFSGVLKHRYSDFQVFEVDLSGNVAHLVLNASSNNNSNSRGRAHAHDDAPAANRAAGLTPDSILAVVEGLAAIAGQRHAASLGSLLVRLMQQQHQAAGITPPAASAAAIPAVQDDQQHLGDPQQPPPADADAAATASGVPGVAAASPAAPEAAAGAEAAASVPADLPPAAEEDHALLGPFTDRATRKSIHEYIKGLLLPGVGLATDTVPSPDGAMNTIRVTPCDPQQAAEVAGRQQKRRREERGGWSADRAWGGGTSQYLRFVLLKENMDTQAALGVVGRMCQQGPGRFGFAGTKDKRGVTCQWVTLHKVAPGRLEGLNSRLRGIKLGGFEYVEDQLRLGQLSGNQFKVLLRGVTAPQEQVAAACDQLRGRGFINYFGLQRFGTGAIPTHHVGAALLRGEWRDAVRLLMTPSPGERPEALAGRKAYLEGGDVQGALRQLPMWMNAERTLLTFLSKAGAANNFCGALLALPRTQRMMYLHAWQAALWNAAASERVKRYGFDRVIPGDLVLPPVGPGKQIGGGGDMVDGEGGAELSGASLNLASVHLVTAEEAAAGRYNVRDVVLPLPGSKVQYPLHAAGWEFYQQLAGKDGILLAGGPPPAAPAAAAAGGPEQQQAEAAGEPQQEQAGAPESAANVDPESTSSAAAASGSTPAADGSSRAVNHPAHRVKDFSLDCLTGDYRRLLHVPGDLQYNFVRYSHPDQEGLVPTDWEMLQPSKGKRQQQQQQQEEEAAAAGVGKEGEQPPSSKRQRLLQSQDVSSGQGGEPSSVAAVQGSAGWAGAGIPAADHSAAAGGGGMGAAAEATGASTEAAEGAAAGEGSGQGYAGASGEGELLGLLLQFQLPPSCYATMLIRELTKESTSKAHYKAMAAAGGPAEEEEQAAEGN